MARYYMFTQVYFNVTGKAMELHLNEWLKETGRRWPADPTAFLEHDDLTATLEMLIALSLLFVASIWVGVYPTWSWLLLPIPLVIEEERSVGPSLGADSVRQGLNSILIGFAAVVVFMIVYYSTAG